jgi:ribosomal-protein-alanine N-acetyltransferase
METHSSREGHCGSHRRLLKIEWTKRPSDDRFQEHSRVFRINGENPSTEAPAVHRIGAVPVTILQYEPHHFAVLYKLDQACFPPGIAYSKTMLRYFLSRPGAECLVAVDGAKMVGFILSEENPPLAHIVTLDVAESYRRHGVGTELLQESEAHLAFRGVRTVLLETATSNAAGIAFWERHGYRKEVVLKNYYPGRLDAFEMRKKLGATPRSAS